MFLEYFAYIALSFVPFIISQTPEFKSRINMYNVYHQELYEGDARPLQYDCMYYDVIDTLLSTRQTYAWSNQLMTFCFRPDNRSFEKSAKIVRSHSPIVRHETYTFLQLKEKSISSSQLMEWSTSMDLIENYQAYLDGDLNIDFNNSEQQYIFYNCTSLWFGPRCQYSFNSKTIPTEYHIYIEYTMGFHYYPPIPSCYIHLECNRDLMKVCLDWREICDEREDCRDGEDERECVKLEENLCNENEFRCHNGQCIPIEFYRDDSMNPDCLDGTDEPFTIENNRQCYQDAAFRCEETACYPQMYTLQPYSCGDGECRPLSGGCWSHRYENTNYPIPPFPWIGFNRSCFTAMTCLTHVSDICFCEQLFGKSCMSIMQSDCPSDLFSFSIETTLFKSLKYIYSKKKFDRQNNVITPSYVCIQRVHCQLNNTIILPNFPDYTCIDHDAEFGKYLLKYPGWDNMNTLIRNYFAEKCSSNKTQCAHSLLYLCSGSSKCISIQRLRDGVENCPLGDDEIVHTCSYNISRTDLYSFKCTHENICWSTLLLNNGEDECDNGEDEIDSRQRYIRDYIRFKYICDGILDMLPINIDGKNMTDETDCEQWNCNNTETHCNSVWNCPRGEDELGCDDSELKCPSWHHRCLSPKTTQLICLPIEKINDGIMDCLGGSDERELCRNIKPHEYNIRYRCWNETYCVLIENVIGCETKTDNKLDKLNFDCRQQNLSSIQKHLCNLIDKRDYERFEISLVNKIDRQFNSSEISSNHPSRIIRRDTEYFEQLCHRGIAVNVVSTNDTDIMLKCICPPSTYGYQCEYQNQRVSLTVQAQSSSDWRDMFTFIFILLTNDNEIESYDHRYYSPSTDCAIKWNIYLLYSSRPKDSTKNYSVRIDVYKRQATTVEYRASWYYRVQFPFLPVYRLAVQITIPSRALVSNRVDCTLNCHDHGSCIIMNPNTNENIMRCRCNPGWIGSQCQHRQEFASNCSCAPGSTCISSYPTSICVCPLDRGGPRCYIKLDPCQNLGNCLNGGKCVPDDERRNALFVKRCVCPKDFWGVHCEFPLTKLIVGFHPAMVRPHLALLHLIQDQQKSTHQRITTFKKIFPYETTTIIRTTVNDFHLAFIEFNYQYYSTHFRKENNYEIQINTQSKYRCLSIDELFNSTFAKIHLLHRIKYYQIPCRIKPNLTCFYDEVHMCICDETRFAICILFEHNKTHLCQGDSGNCENGGKCFQDHAQCPTKSACLCSDCFYGSKCQFSSQGFSLSLDSIIGYQIRPEKDFQTQLFVVKFCVILISIIFIIGMINGILSLLIFKSSEAQKIGCGLYLFTASLLSILTIITLSLKLTFLLLTQMTYITNITFLHIQCRIIDYILRICLSLVDWLSACVAIERAFIVFRKTKFHTKRSKQMAKRVILFLFIACAISNVHETIFRRIIIDDDENENDARIWCVVSYPSSIQKYNTIIQIIHFLTPFICNIISALIVLHKITRQAGKERIRKQLKQHKHLIISPTILVLLASPRLIISLVLDCMKLDRDPWIFLAGYFISFTPSLLIFIVFILPSTSYRNEWKKLYD